MTGTISYLCGFEMGTPNEAWTVGTNAPSVQTTVKRSGAYALSLANTTNNYLQFQSIAAGGTSRSIFQSARFFLRVDALPTSGNVQIAALYTAALGLHINLLMNTSGALVVNGVVTSTNTFSADAAFHRIEWDVGWNAGAGSRVYVDGVEWASQSTGALSAQPILQIGTGNGNGGTFYVDDLVAFSDDLGGVNWSDWSVSLLKPTSDNARGNWTGGAGGTTNLWDALNNVPPVGLTAGSDTNTSQIQDAVSATYPATAAQRGDFNCQTYTTGGVGAADTILAVQAICNHGEGVATGTKAGGLYIVSNPAQSSPGQDFDYGDDAGAIGTFPTNWKTAVGPATASPSVTLGTAPVVGVHKNNASTRETHVDFLGIYVAYSPGLPPELMGRPDGLHGQQQMHQLLSQ